MCRANQVVMVPLSQLTMALLLRRLPNSQATSCGFIGLSRREARSSMIFHHSFAPSCAFFRKLRSCLRFSNGIKICRARLLSPIKPTSTGKRSPDLLRVQIDLNPFGLVGLGHGFDVWKSTADDEDRIARLNCFL